MKLLAIETCFKKSSVCLYLDGNFHENIESQANRHVNSLPEMTKSLLANHNTSLHQLDGIIVNHGPGAFTGLRVGVAFAKGLVAPFNTPLYGISTLECYVHDTTPQTIAVPGLKDFFYVQSFTNAIPCGEVSHLDISQVQSKNNLVTSGVHIQGEVRHYEEMPTASLLIKRFLFHKPDIFQEPLYVRPVNAQIPQNMKKIL